MLDEIIAKFHEMAPLWLSKLIDDEMPEIEKYDDMAVLEYDFKYPMDMEAVLDVFEDDVDLNVLYQAVSPADGKMHVCAISTPVGEYMHKINIISDENEIVKGMTVTLLTSIEQFNSECMVDVELHKKKEFDFEFIMDDSDYAALFM